MYFDTHIHVFSRGLPLAKNCRYVPDYDAKPESYLAHLNKHGFSKGILIQPSFLGTDNSYMLTVMEKYPDRFYGVAVLEPNIAFSKMEEMKRKGIIGIRLNLIGQQLPDLTSPVWQQHLQHVKMLGWHVELHRQVVDLPLLIDTLLQADVKIVVDHFALPSETEKEHDAGFRYLLSRAKTEKIWVKISASYRNGNCQHAADNTKTLLPLLLTNFGPRRLLWGSDWPHTRYEDRITYDGVVNEFYHWDFSEQQREAILSQSAEELIHQ